MLLWRPIDGAPGVGVCFGLSCPATMNVTKPRRALTSWVSAQTVDDLATWPFDSSSVPVPERLGRYQISALIGAGGMGAVYQGHADGFSSPVAIKTLRKLSPTGLLNFKQEFRRARTLNHPNLVSLYELGQDGTTWFFSMELVEGETLLEYTWGGKVYPGVRHACERLAPILPQLLDAISYLHQNNVLHLDIKPSNVLVTEAGIAKLLDFGLCEVEFTSEHAEPRGAFAGTPAYMAPEQLWGKHSKACDAYALGVTLFEVVTGNLPLAPRLETLLTKQTKAAPRVRDVAPETPEHLAQVIDALLERDSERRMKVDEARLNLGMARAPTSLLPPRHGSLVVGREAELEHLAHWLEVSRTEVLVGTLVGESGVGKTTLLSIAKSQWAASGAWVLSSRCFEWQSISFKAADSIVDALFERAQSEPAPLNLPVDLALASATFPVLAGLPLEVVPGRPTDKQLERDRALEALATWIAELAERNPIVLCIDDAQWGDVESAELIARCTERARLGLLVVLGSRPTEQEHAFHRRLAAVRAQHQTLALEPLTYSESYSLARRIAAESQWTDEDLRAIALDAAGVPLFVEQVARYAQLGDVRPKSLADVVAGQYQSLPSAARQLLDVVVLDEHPTPFAAALLAAGQQQKDFHSLSLLQAHGFVRVEGLSEATVLEPFHDRIRRELVRLIPVAVQQTLHGSLARALEATSASPNHIAEHWFKAGDLDRASAWTVKAAQDAYESLAFERASALYSRALAWNPRALEATPQALEQHAWALYHAGHCAAAGQAFVAAATVAAPAAQRLLQGHAIEALLVAGEVERGQAVLAGLLPQLGISPVWRGFWGGVQLLYLIARVRLKVRRLRLRATPDPLALQRADVTWAAGKAFTNLLPVDGIVHLLRSLLFALDSGDAVAIARGLSIAASGYVPFLESKSADLLEAASAIAERHPSAYLLGMRDVALSTASTMLGNWRQAMSQIDTASRHLEAADIPTHWERAVLAANRTACLEQLGHLRESTELFERAAVAAKQRGDMIAFIGNWASVGFGRLAANDAAGLDAAIAEYTSVVGRWKVGYGIWDTALWHLKVLRALRRHSLNEAHQLLDAEWRHIVGAHLHRTRALRLYILETRAAVNLASRPASRAERSAWLKEAHWLRRQTVSTNRRDAKANAQLIAASIAHCLGNTDQSLAALEEAADIYAAESMAERETSVRWRIAALTKNVAECQRLEEVAATLGIVDMATWAPLRTPGFWSQDD